MPFLPTSHNGSWMTVRGPRRQLITEVQNFCYRPQERFWCQVCWLGGSGVCCAACCSSYTIITIWWTYVLVYGVWIFTDLVSRNPQAETPCSCRHDYNEQSWSMVLWYCLIIIHIVFCGRWCSQIRKTVRSSGSAKQSLASAWRMQAWYGRRWWKAETRMSQTSIWNLWRRLIHRANLFYNWFYNWTRLAWSQFSGQFGLTRLWEIHGTPVQLTETEEPLNWTPGFSCHSTIASVKWME